MAEIDLPLLLEAVTAGGPSALSSVTPLRPAAGDHAVIAPAKYADDRSDMGTFVYDVRFIDRRPQRTVLIDSSQSQGNRVEQALDLAIRDGSTVLGRVPGIRVTYDRGDGTEEYWDRTLPHRAFDAHVRAGTVDGQPTTEHPAYRAARDSNPLDASALFALSPLSLVLGSWDATRRARQGRWPSALTGETVGVLTDRGGEDGPPLKGGARVDPVGMSTAVDADTLIALADGQRSEMSPKTYDKIIAAAAKLKPGQTTSLSGLGFGGIPPALGQLGGVSCTQILRSRVLSFATLRQMRFGAGARGDAACRAVLAALALNGVARADQELYLRAHCHLVEAAPTHTRIDRRQGNCDDVVLPTPDEADALLEAALADAAEHAGVDWHGQVLEVQGNPAILAGAEDENADSAPGGN